MKKLLLFFLVGITLNAYTQGTNCGNADPFCTGTTYTFPNSTGVPNMGSVDCLGSTPNPAFYYMEIDANGSMTIQISQVNSSGTPIDVDFIIWGPYTSLAAACATNLMNTSGVDCSYSTSATETAVLPSVSVGQVYVLLLTNYANQPGTITFNQSGGAGSADCSLLCGVNSFTAVPGSCNSATNQYSVSGNFNISNPPSSGMLTITSSCGGTPQVFNAPFASSINYTVNNITSTGAGCTISATFSADGTCNSTVNYTSPPPCNCSITGLTSTPTACNPATNQYGVSGNVNFTNPPTTGSLTVSSSCGGTQTFNAPFTSPLAYNLTGLTSTGAGCTVTAVFSANPSCTNTSSYTAPASCNCIINNFTANISAPTCGATGGTYNINGVVQTTSPPATGTLTVSSSCGGTQTFTAPFATTINYNLTGINANGANCTVSAVYSANPACTASLTYTAPTCPCNIDSLQVSIGACAQATNNYEADVHLVFSSPPSSGTLNVTVCGNTQTINAPFTSPLDLTFPGLPSTGGACSVTATFSANPTCNISLNYTAPNPCPCTADAGTVTANMVGDGNTNFVLCDGDQINIVSNGDNSPASDEGVLPGGYAYNPGYGYLIYSCPPTAGLDPLSDPCFQGVLSTGVNANDVNDMFVINSFPAGTFTNNTVYYSLFTFYDLPNLAYDLNCFDVGPPTAVTYLPVITVAGVEDCTNGTVTVTVSGGHPSIFGTQFTASNLSPATASFVNTTCGNNGTIVISGLNDGDMYSFDIVDQNGCPVTFSGGPFDGPDVAVIGPAGPFCEGSAPQVIPTTIPGGTWNASCGGCINSGTGSFDPGAAGVGIHSVSYTPPGCAEQSTINVTVTTNFDATITPQPAVCENSAPVIFTAVDGTGTWSATCGACINAVTGSFDPATAGPGNHTITYTIAGACGDTDTETFTVNADADPTINPQADLCVTDAPVILNPVQAGGSWSATCGACIDAITGSFDPAIATAGTHTITYTLGGPCGADSTIDITVQEVILNSIDVVPVLCFGDNNGSITINATGATQYSVTGGAPFSAGNTFGSLAANTYNIVIENAIGCQATGTATITSPTQLDITAGVLINESCFAACDAQVAALPSGGTTPYDVDWTGAATGSGLSLSNICHGTYIATVTDTNGCVDSVSITLNPLTPVVITSVAIAQPLCNGGTDGSLTVTATAGSAMQYSLNGGPLQASNAFINLPAGTYTIAVQDASGCSDDTTVTIGEPTVVTTVSSPDVTICIGQSTTIGVVANGGTGTYTYAWDHGLGNLPSHSVSPGGTDVYNVVVTDANGCGNIAETIIVTVNPPLNVVALSDQTICPGGTAAISAIANGGNGGAYTYTWTNNQNASVLIGQNQTVSPSVVTDYIVTVNDGCGTPVAKDTITISLFTLPQVTFDQDTTEGCSPVVVNFTNTMNPADVSSCLWNYGDGTFGNSCNDQHVFTQAGCYNITLTVTTNNGCVVNHTENNLVCVFAVPVADFTFSPQPTDVFFPEINFTNLSLGANHYHWDFEGLGSSTQQNPAFTFPADSGGIYTVCLDVSNNDGCRDTTCHDILVQDQFLLYVPNAFTPDGDGVNDIFLPILQGEEPDTYELLVFDRWGELIFRSNNKLIGWDGRHKGIDVKDDVYVWKVRLRKKAGSDLIERTGHITKLE